MNFFIKVEINDVTQNLSAVESIIYSFVKEWIKRYGRPYDQGLLFMQENMPFKTTTRTLITNIKNLEKYSIFCTKRSIGGNTLISIISDECTQTSSEKSSHGVVKNFHMGSEEFSHGVVKNFHMGSEKFSHDIIDHDRLMDRYGIDINGGREKNAPAKKNPSQDFQKKSPEKNERKIPDLNAIISYFSEKGITEESAKKFYSYNNDREWRFVGNDWTKLADRWILNTNKINKLNNTNSNKSNIDDIDKDLLAFFEMTAIRTGKSVEEIKATYLNNQNEELTKQRKAEELDKFYKKNANAFNDGE